MTIKFHVSSFSAPLLLQEKQQVSNQATGTTTSAEPSETSSSTRRSIIQNGVKNWKKFSLRFGHNDTAASVATQKNRKSVSVSSIGTPVIRSDSKLREIKEPDPSELKTRIEQFRDDKKKNLNSETCIKWDDYLQATKDSSLHNDIAALRTNLIYIDNKVERSIDELRLTAYEDIRNAKTKHTPAYEIDAKNKTKATLQERFMVGARRVDMRTQRLSKRESMIRVQEALDVESAIGRFEQRITDDFEPNRLKDMSKACLKLLQKHFDGEFPAGPLYQLVREISPDAVKRYIEYHSKLSKESPLLASLAAAVNSDDARELFGQPTNDIWLPVSERSVKGRQEE